MFISALKKQENIAEYVLYMWQIEDVIRACNFDIEKIDSFILAKQDLAEEHSIQLRKWYSELSKKMKLQKIETTGHLYEVSEIIMELSYLHTTLIEVYKDEKYISLYTHAETYLEEFKKVSNNPKATNIEIFFNALYAKLILKLQKKDISSSTEQAFETFTNVLAYIAAKYKEVQAGT